jgi:hypothetical protein
VQARRTRKCRPSHVPTQRRKVQSPPVVRYDRLYRTVDDAEANRRVHAQSANSIRRCNVVAR